MKNSILYLLVFSLVFLNTSKKTIAQELWGMTPQGGIYNKGVIFKTDVNGNNQDVVYSFISENDGRNPYYSDLVQALNGKLYGMTYSGGTSNYGVLFEYDPATNTYTKKLDFDGTAKGSYPYGSLIQGINGKLYGMTRTGGTSNYGVLFEYEPASDTYTKKLDFDETNKGSNPYGSLVQASNGKLYGMTSSGGTFGGGVLFEYDPATNTYTKKLDFDGTAKGSNPIGSLIQTLNGKLFGMTQYGGTFSGGVLFEYDPAANTYTKKLDFDGTAKGSNPRGSLVQASNGKLYGMTRTGGASNYGVLFEYDPASNTYTKKLDFDGTAKGRNPYGSLVQALNGKLYTMTTYGGTSDSGVLFEYDPVSNSYTKKMDFDGVSEGRNPYGSLMQAYNGKLYGMTFQGGISGMGVLFEYDPVSDTYIIKLNFDETIEGSQPFGSLVQALNGKIYGMARMGGNLNEGVLFEYDPASDTYTKKLDFNGLEKGRNPIGSLIQALNGKLYGMTYLGGTFGYGVLFEYDPALNIYTKKVDFDGTERGSHPMGSLVQAVNAKLYGMTFDGGTLGYGVLFEYDPSSDSYTKKLDFDGTAKGRSPYGSLMQALNGKLYGMTALGGTLNDGVLFEYDPVSDTYTKKLDFEETEKGINPMGSLMQASNGKLYGLTRLGGASNVGVLFEYAPALNTYTKKVDFDGTSNGSQPLGSLTQASNGKLYGLTYTGGTSAKGALFEYDAVSNTFTKKMDFTGSNGANPMYCSLIEVGGSLAPVAVCQNVTIQLNESGEASLDPSQIDGGSTGTAITLSASKTLFTCSDVGQNSVVLTVTDSNDNTSQCTATVTVTDDHAPVISTNGDKTIETDAGTCGATVEVSATALDNCQVDDPAGVRSDGLALTDPFPVGKTTITWNTKDVNNNPATPVTQSITVTNTLPVISLLTGPTDPKLINYPVTITVEHNDNNVVNAAIKWDDATTAVQNITNPSNGSFTVEHTYTTPGVYSVVVTLTDACGAISANYQYDYIVAFDPNGGFVTGGGWIISPPGAFVADEQLSGKANFGFVAKYKKGSTVPDGNTEFQFKAGNLNFNSTAYEDMRLVIAGSKANYKGTGTINGGGNYGFMVSAIDGNILGGGGVDKFRIKIWDKNSSDAIVYDNNMGKDENDIPTTTLGGGSIVIHSSDNKNKIAHFIPEASTAAFEPVCKVYPNPFTDRLNIEFSNETDAHAKLEIYSITGSRLAILFDGNIQGGELHTVEFLPKLISSQMVFYQLVINGKTFIGKATYIERR